MSPAGARAGAWTQPPGGFYAKVEGAARSTRERFDASGDRVNMVSGLSPARYDTKQLRGYAELGLIPNLTGVASLAWQRLRVEEEAVFHQTEGFSDLRLGARLGLLRENNLVSAAMVEVKIPTGYDETEFPSLGDAKADVSVSLQVGTSFGRGYAGAEVGYNFRGGSLANEIPFSVELGYRVVPRGQVRGALRGRRAVRAMDEIPDPTFDPAQVDARNLDAAGTIAFAVTPEWDLETGITHTLSGRNTLTGTEFSLGLAWHR